ncbi:carbon monoxide dehydrogenase [Humibacillus sp. DSM 29435]|uniref:SRPBCC family protein n=1 Tax=Humibacillus sp. DSM 29435 TaxID=1869167 RepID=UPI000873474A|nr:SRPBCC family protein [Humibacillus sp. DSM 29435]OFE17269.1 carbon monoxide dehydrogenase [Humibacillus sp. DSM 29435]
MDLTHSFTVPTSVDDAWALFMDLEKVGSCFPGATVTEVRDGGFSGTVKVKLGPIAMVYSGTGSFVERDDAAHTAVISAKGKDKRGNGTAGATVTLSLSPDGEGSRADVVTDLAVTGKPAQFGRGVMQDVSDKLLQAFVACVEKQLGGDGEAPEGPATGSSSAASPGEPAPAAGGTAPETGFIETASDALAADTTKTPPSASSAAVTPPRPASAPARPQAVTPAHDDDALDLGSAVLPVLVRRYSGFAAAALAGVLLGWLLGRRH